MTLLEAFKALFLGLLEGATEFIPVSSTGHLILLQSLFGLDGHADKTFAILIQFGAILAILSAYFARLWSIALALPHDPKARRFVIGVLVAFLPAAIIGVLARDFILGVLFDPRVVCTTLILGGIVLLFVDRMNLPQRHEDATRFPISMYLKIGIIQCLAMIPGVSRSGATIVGAMLMGSSKRAAAEFSFFLAMPTMAGAFVWELGQSYGDLSADDATMIAIGFVSAFVAGLFVVRSLLDYVSKHGFALFGWWRIIVGSVGFVGLLVFG
ncbi:undecaprenyl-diphosphate phosphatase [Salinarimonas ramus]|uniref:Undecaprenyl-diphosphatase n=1 Tax=Salinarimonas ramus TaxID=690164 RepID=A0A917V4W8_9HYPH|nr:undecaprenyl-diphosphate phosphatase [Salinarimonas ramus]GGK37136.1 undecaprenyl-diphosphatase [Salinarimonas ramus]